ncbi:hypothetical protein QPK13_12725 [Photorhabdus tasmaniensis]|uniref:hypothetical protein n=1 Tax=Photorhabdus sp. RM323S TaxID=3342828 RepID=UPI0036DAB9B5
MTFENGTVVSQKTLYSDEKVLTLNTFMELAQRAGYLIIHRENFMSMETAGSTNLKAKDGLHIRHFLLIKVDDKHSLNYNVIQL